MYLEEMYIKHRQDELRKKAEHHRLVKSLRANHATSWRLRAGETLLRTAVRLLQTGKADPEICIPLQKLPIATGRHMIELRVSNCCTEG